MWELLKLLNIDTTELILYLVMIFCVWFLLREVKCWYWKINEAREAQEEQTELLREIIEELKKITDKESTP